MEQSLKKYYIIKNGIQFGPISIDDFKQENVLRTTKIWYEGLEEWTEAVKIPELNAYFKSIPPPVYSNIETSKKGFNNKIFIYISISAILLFAICYFIINSLNNDSSTKETNDKNNKEKTEGDEAVKVNNDNEELEANSGIDEGHDNSNSVNANDPKALKENLFELEKNNPRDYISANASWRVNIGGNTIIEGTVFNRATLATFKNFKIRVSFFTKTGTLLGDEVFTVYEFCYPKKSTAFKHKMIGWWQEATNMKMEILNIESN